MGTQNPAETWHCIDGDGQTFHYTLCTLEEMGRRGWYARRRDGRRFTITTWFEDGEPQAVLSVKAPGGWDEVHRSEHRSIRKAKVVARLL